jgi:hypothetical protein
MRLAPVNDSGIRQQRDSYPTVASGNAANASRPWRRAGRREDLGKVQVPRFARNDNQSPSTPHRVPSGSRLAWSQSASNRFTGTLTVTGTVINAAVTFALFHVAEEHEDFGPLTVTISSL